VPADEHVRAVVKRGVLALDRTPSSRRA